MCMLNLLLLHLMYINILDSYVKISDVFHMRINKKGGMSKNGTFTFKLHYYVIF